MLLLQLLACGAPSWGTWMFTRTVPLPTGDECTQSVSHNVAGATEPADAAEDTGWIEEDTGETSPEVFFGRLERTSDGALLILGDDALPGTLQDDGSWLFWWKNSDEGEEDASHASGYAWRHQYATSSLLRVAGDLTADTFTGTYENETASTLTWSESDAWSEEAAVYVGENGEIPVGEYLEVVDATTGQATAANNAREATECGDSGTCTLSVTSGCVYRSTLTGVATELTPEDAPWAEDAGQPAGN